MSQPADTLTQQVRPTGETMGKADDWRSWIRSDVSNVAPLGGYAAKRCPVRTQLDVLRPCEPAGVSNFLRALADGGIAFEADVYATLEEDLELTPVQAEDRAEAEAATLAAMQAGSPIITGGRLPTDLDGRRAGEPDILVRIGEAPVDGRWRYAPADVKHHGIVRLEAGAEVVVQAIDQIAVPSADAETTPDGRRDGTARGDLLQLAHYHRMLEACGHASVDVSWGGIVGSEGQVVWFSLDEPLWRTPTSDPESKTKLRSSLEVYDFEFGFRLDIAAAALAHQLDPSHELLVLPVDIPECSECPWRNHCWPQLDETGDVSRLPGVHFSQWRALRDAGLGTIAAFAASTRTSIEGMTDAQFAKAQLEARARLGDQPVYLRPDGAADVPWADIEVDIDMENVASGAYLWGATVTVRRPETAAAIGITPGHRSFATWADPLDDNAIADCFGSFWSWLSALRAACATNGIRLATFCWNQGAENGALRHGGDVLGVRDEVEAFIASRQWIDLLAWCRTNLVTGTSLGLKVVATALGFAWRDEDPGGAASMLWYAEAIGDDEDAAAAARQRLVAYNEDDCRATLAVRDVLAAGNWTTPPIPNRTGTPEP